MPIRLVKWIMRHVDPLICEFRYKHRVIVFSRELVSKILGLQNGNAALVLSGDSEAVNELRELYKEGERAPIKKCIDVLKKSTDRASFLRAFMLLALGTIYCPRTGNYVEMKYLHSLVNIADLSSYDWSGHVISLLMDEVRKYQQFSDERLEHDHQIGSCLVILAVGFYYFSILFFIVLFCCRSSI